MMVWLVLSLVLRIHCSSVCRAMLWGPLGGRWAQPMVIDSWLVVTLHHADSRISSDVLSRML